MHSINTAVMCIAIMPGVVQHLCRAAHAYHAKPTRSFSLFRHPTLAACSSSIFFHRSVGFLFSLASQIDIMAFRKAMVCGQKNEDGATERQAGAQTANGQAGAGQGALISTSYVYCCVSPSAENVPELWMKERRSHRRDLRHGGSLQSTPCQDDGDTSLNSGPRMQGHHRLTVWGYHRPTKWALPCHR